MFQGEVIQNFQVTTVTYIVTTLPNSATTYIDELSAIFTTAGIDLFPTAEGLPGEVAIFGSTSALSGDPNLTWSTHTANLDISGSLTISSPVSGALQISDGTQEAGYVFTSDARSMGSWRLPVCFNILGM